MEIYKLIDCLPDSVKADLMDFNDIRLKDGRTAIRVTVDRLITEDEEKEMQKSKHLVGVGCVAQYRYAPEIQKSYFYVV